MHSDNMSLAFWSIQVVPEQRGSQMGEVHRQHGPGVTKVEEGMGGAGGSVGVEADGNVLGWGMGGALVKRIS